MTSTRAPASLEIVFVRYGSGTRTDGGTGYRRPHGQPGCTADQTAACGSLLCALPAGCKDEPGKYEDCDDAHGSLHFQAALAAKTINAGPELPLLRPPWAVANVLTLGKKMPRDLPPTVNIFFRQALTAKSSTGEQARCIALLLL